MLIDGEESGAGHNGPDRGRRPVDLQLEWVLGKMPQKLFKMERVTPSLQPLSLPAGLTVKDALERVLRLPAVASKRYLTNKVRAVRPTAPLLASGLGRVNTFAFAPSTLPRWTGL